MACHANVSARHESVHEEFAPITEVVAKVLFLFVRSVTVKRGNGSRWLPPPSAAIARRRASGAQLRQFFLGEFQNAVGRIGANSVHRMAGAVLQPFKTVACSI